MSAIFFHTRDKDYAIQGAERALMSNMITSIAMGVIDSNIRDYPSTPSIFREILPPGSFPLEYGGTTPQFEQNTRLYLSGYGDRCTVIVEGKEVPVWDINLNTAYAIGSDLIKLLVRIHAQCEIHCYIEPQYHSALANLVEHGMKINVLRESLGWPKLIAALRESHELLGDVVLSYSVTDQFPNPYLLTIPEGTDEEREEWEEAWYAKPRAEQWEECMPALRSRTGCLDIDFPLDPDYRFGNCLTWFDVITNARGARSD